MCTFYVFYCCQAIVRSSYIKIEVFVKSSNVICCFFVFMYYNSICLYFFFFQAEDGIRDLTVTGVQTLLFRSPGDVGRHRRQQPHDHQDAEHAGHRPAGAVDGAAATPGQGPLQLRTDEQSEGLPGEGRSEERRVEKECRARWWASH